MKKIMLNGSEIIVSELKVKDIRKLQKLASSNEELPVLDIIEKNILPCCVQGIRDIDELTISEARELWDTFKEVNKSFLEIIAALQSGDAKKIFL